ncbi:hypothetical protein NXW80_16480 [Bacteroides fragilis]|nr:hypothetical protein [Bacteroides fragilis]
MKKTYLWTAMLCTAIAFSACKSNKAGQDTASEAKTEEAAIPGSDKDEHGCVGSAGYVWSEVKKDCIRPFEAGLKISETQKDNATYATYIVFAADSVQAELYTPESGRKYPARTCGQPMEKRYDQRQLQERSMEHF